MSTREKHIDKDASMEEKEAMIDRLIEETFDLANSLSGDEHGTKAVCLHHAASIMMMVRSALKGDGQYGPIETGMDAIRVGNLRPESQRNLMAMDALRRMTG